MKIFRKFRFAVLALVGISSLVTSCQRNDNQQQPDHEHDGSCGHNH